MNKGGRRGLATTLGDPAGCASFASLPLPSYAGYPFRRSSDTKSHFASVLNHAPGTLTVYGETGNLISDGTRTFTYDVENRLVGASGGVTLAYDPMGGLQNSRYPLRDIEHQREYYRPAWTYGQRALEQATRLPPPRCFLGRILPGIC
jgi:hypothetical protein